MSNKENQSRNLSDETIQSIIMKKYSGVVLNLGSICAICLFMFSVYKWVNDSFSAIDKSISSLDKNLSDKINQEIKPILSEINTVKESTKYIWDILIRERKIPAENIEKYRSDIGLNSSKLAEYSLQQNLSSSDYHTALEILKTQPLESAKKELVEKKLFTKDQVKNILQPAMQNSPQIGTMDHRY